MSYTTPSVLLAIGFGVSRGYGTDGQNRYTTSGPLNLSYDARGNLQSDTQTSQAYDIANRLTSVSNGAQLGYDAGDRLAWVKGQATTQFLYEGDHIIGEYQAGALLRRFAPGALPDQPSVWYEGSDTSRRSWFLADRQGSVVGLADASANPGYNTYDEAGLPGPSNTGRFQYDGQPWIAEAGLYHMRARAYSPTLGRFMQPDPSGYADGLNLYGYALADPVNAADPSGLQCTSGGVASFLTCQPANAPEQHGVVVIGHPDEADNNKQYRGAAYDFANTTELGGALASEGRDVIDNEVVVTAKRPSHNYSFTDQIAPRGCYPSAAALKGLAASFAIPGQNPNSPVRDGQRSNARVGPFSGPIVTYINGTTSVNVTLPGHIFYYGSVTRTTSVGANGAVYVSTHGVGTNSSDAIAMFNQYVGPLIFRDVNDKEAAYISNNAICSR